MREAGLDGFDDRSHHLGKALPVCARAAVEEARALVSSAFQLQRNSPDQARKAYHGRQHATRA